jgi:hypothetical protein
MDRAKGLKPSIAEESYLANLDRLMASQQAAAGSVRGQDRALAMRGIAQQASQAGQQAVRETSILRMQEQQAAEKAAADQANMIMIEDQKLASQEKANELQRNVQILSAELQNQKNLLERDIFNADAMNKITMLDAQLRNQTEQLNAEIQNRVNLQNASERTKVSLQNAIMQTDTAQSNAQRALDANKWAGGQAQQAFTQQVALERDDWRSAADVQDKATQTQRITYGTLAQELGDLGTAKEGWNTAQGTLSLEQQKLAEKIRAAKEAGNASEVAALWNMVATFGPAVEKVFEKIFPEEKKTKYFWED